MPEASFLILDPLSLFFFGFEPQVLGVVTVKFDLWASPGLDDKRLEGTVGRCQGALRMIEQSTSTAVDRYP